ncbi:hypothetical protein A2630_02020 [Candidatus Woesebacteria bacterium RIFCSPHIGHO2_01_FULL_44_10]|uniref:Aerotolerance regulator N-terminal domain-containing protein n=1 Tax=Candidatus Woesebacteria bacterium RIFCSPLOWO2_01_FULL_44_14 TaxID=1802525 RepID=A0A1F8BY70_9BACT|nr:MAG: hypothetical protein A2630_02020 [Candidatus Woesebacteria bacterium RIFCSPHIGHO2_01_FULL_44_10]OGM55787.1 MAG: hypothetical protein A3F62_04145 [Candidatus Woesebacteria bacterium RIFCSPHIGHO2_12_FULL_44_11]OGM68982.1 MAG: hypothetical protein A2975_02265 [Candidatus Woesebacteria bacterium RIFCSPLOWO2_01_FULL_44_14]
MQLTNSIVIFFQNNSWLALVVLSLPFFYFAYFLTRKSIRNMKTKISDYYPFNVILPKSTTWSSLFLLAIVSILALVLYLVSQKGFVLSPA